MDNIPLFFSNFLDGLCRFLANPGVIDQDVNFTEGSDGGFNQLRDLNSLADISFYGKCFSTQLLDFFLSGLEAVFFDITDDYICPFFGKSQCERSAIPIGDAAPVTIATLSNNFMVFPPFIRLY